MRGAGADGLVVAMKPGNAGERRGPTSRPRDMVNPQGEEPWPVARPAMAGV